MSCIDNPKGELQKMIAALDADCYRILAVPHNPVRSTYTVKHVAEMRKPSQGFFPDEIVKPEVINKLRGINGKGNCTIKIICKSMKYHYVTLYDVSQQELYALSANGVKPCIVSLVRVSKQGDKFYSVVLRFSQKRIPNESTYAKKVSGSFQISVGSKLTTSLEEGIVLCGFVDKKSRMWVNANRAVNQNCPTCEDRFGIFLKNRSANESPEVMPELDRSGSTFLYFESCRSQIIYKATSAGDKFDDNEINCRLSYRLQKEHYSDAEITQYIEERNKPQEVSDF
ncbi:hypothetical protein ALP72_02249 [Pseudomonas coronafaciens pv. coronafaciens]|uniref:hypothetical protein n=1 Tax=Pseudomonas coronafaciens TaxID=53409 RepID=UPI000EFE8920|nr:hypothetical protein [Pseudomonas coronafaciens]RMS11904.1 hypothetical protein ALP72_02249 [Pseudomonas coronafaciens pv. coronafaciens]